MPPRGKRERYSIAASLAAAIVAFPVALLLFGIIVRGAIIGIADSLPLVTDYSLLDRIVEITLMSTMFGAPLLLAYLTSRWMYVNLRWEDITHGGRYCANCGYDLTGNISGRCPECGEKIEAGHP